MTNIINIPKGILRVDTPDHPFTFDGPDMLLSDSNGLLAIFHIRENEQKNTNKLFSRLTNSLIAYPAHTKMILLLDKQKEIPTSINQIAKYYFNELIELKDLKKSKSLIRDKKAVLKINEIKYIQKKLFTIQSQIQNDNLNYIKKSEFKEKELREIPFLKEKAKYFDKINQREISARANIFEFENQIFGIKKLSNNTSDLVELKPFYEFVINSEFSVDNGVPYFNHLSRKVLNINDIPSLRFDPLKPTRIASLFGWHLINSNDFEQIEKRISKYKK